MSGIPRVAVVGLCLLIPALGWPSGAPEQACTSLTPQHGNNRPKPGSSSPFSLTQSHQDYEPGDKVKVMVNSPPQVSFKGLLVQAYDPATGQPVGTFQSGRGLKTIDSCAAVTHGDKRGKRSATLLWQAPQTASGQVAFRATVVQRFSEFYHGVEAGVDQNI